MSHSIFKNRFNLIAAFLACWAVTISSGITVRNPLTVVFFVFFLLLAERESFRIKGISNIVSSIISLALSLGLTALLYKRATASFENRLFKLMGIVILVSGFFMLGRILLGEKRSRADGEEAASKEKESTSKADAKKHSIIDKASAFMAGSKGAVIAKVMIVCLICWLPYFLYEFPGIMTADSIVQYYEIIGMEPVSNHHPILHTLIIAFFYKVGMFISGNPLVVVALYTVFQMIFLSFCCGVLIWHVESLKIRLFALAFFALVPFNAVFAVTMWKDIIFAGITMLLLCKLSDFIKDFDNAGVSYYVLLVILMILFALFRSNAWYALIFWTPFAIFFFRKKLVPFTVSMLIVIATVVVIKGPVMSSFGVAQPDLVESLSVPIQQIARMYVDGASMTSDEVEAIAAVVDTEWIEKLYVANYADNIKELIRAGHPEVILENKGEYFSLWAGLVLRHPVEAVKAWFDLVGGYIYPDVAYRVGDIDGVISNEAGIYWNPIIGGKFVKIKEILIKLGGYVPLYGLLWSIGTYTWALVISFIRAIRSKDEIITKLLLIMMIGTLLIASPVVDFRYGYGIVMTMPLWIEVKKREKAQ